MGEMFGLANRRAHDGANRRMRAAVAGERSVHAAVAAAEAEAFAEPLAGWLTRLGRWVVALLLLPLCWVTTWTFLSRFSSVTVERGFWQSAEFWYFATGVLLMVGWFWSGLLKTFFLYLYVLGHELTHALFVLLFRGKVTDFHVSADGGYITTNKTNLLIALSPYFLPFWSVVCVGLYGFLRIAAEPKPGWDLVFYGMMGLTWTFHMAWTIWMLPRDQPDLRQNGTFLSLVVIYLANLLVLVALLCASEGSPLRAFREFGNEWLRHAAVWADLVWRRVIPVLSGMAARQGAGG